MKPIPLGYGTYGLKNEDTFKALPRLREIGYDVIELTVAKDWPTAPAKLDAGARKSLVALFQKLGFPPPILMMLPQLFTPEVTQAGMEKEWHELCQLAKDLNFTAASPIITFTLGGNVPEWETGRDQIAEKIAQLGRIAGEHGVTLAAEPHAGCSFDRAERAVWLVRQVNQPHVRLNCDISHFIVQGFDVEKELELMIPYSVYAHIKDAAAVGMPPKFVLPGKGGYDLAKYYGTLERLKYAGPVVVEVSGMVWNAAGYEPWEAAQFCFDVLDKARRQPVRS